MTKKQKQELIEELNRVLDDAGVSGPAADTIINTAEEELRAVDLPIDHPDLLRTMRESLGWVVQTGTREFLIVSTGAQEYQMVTLHTGHRKSHWKAVPGDTIRDYLEGTYFPEEDRSTIRVFPSLDDYISDR